MASAKGPVVVLTGAGSGGHITPVLAVADAIKQANPAVTVVYIGQRGDKLGDIGAGHSTVDQAYVVSAGKFRRYHGLGWRQLFKVRTMLLNIRDAFRVLTGIAQSVRLLRRLRPGVVFIKGGFVGVPVGLAAAWLHIPYVTHDSDALPGLANRIVARWAALHTVALPKEIYAYPQAKTITVGVPIAAHYAPVNAQGRQAARQRIGLPKEGRMVLVAGGGLGSKVINDTLVASLPDVLQRLTDVHVVQQAGRAHELQLTHYYNTALPATVRSRVHVLGFVTNMYDYVAAADVVVTRAGGTNLTELAVAQKPCIVIPNPYLTGGHQIKNAKVLADRGAIVLLEESTMLRDPQSLPTALMDLLQDAAKQQALRTAIGQLAVPDASSKLAVILLDLAGGKAGDI